MTRTNLVLSSVLLLVIPLSVCPDWGLQFFFFYVIYPFSLSIIFFLFSYIVPELFCFLFILMLICRYAFTASLLIKFSFVILEGPVLILLLNFVWASFKNLLFPIYFSLFFPVELSIVSVCIFTNFSNLKIGKPTSLLNHHQLVGKSLACVKFRGFS